MASRCRSSGSDLARALLLAAAAALPARAGQPGHYAPGTVNIRDPFTPDPGTYLQLYVPFSHSGEYHDGQGDAVHALTINPGPGQARVNVNVNSNVLTLAPSLQWIAPRKILGARYGAVFAPSFGNSNVSTAANSELGGQSSSSGGSSSLSMGDLFVEPLWLDWELERWEFSASYGFYAPTGKYNVETTAVQDLQGRTIFLRDPAPDSVGLGFWEHQFQGAVAWYPRPDKRTAFVLTGTYEHNENKRFEDLTPGPYFTLNWGISRYFPLKGEDLLGELGPAGYLTWQTARDRGADATFTALGYDAAAGVQAGLTYVPWGAFLDLQYSREFRTKARTQGETYALSMARKIF